MQRSSSTARRTRVEKHPGVYWRTGRDGKRAYEVTFVDSTGRRRWQRVEGGLREAQDALDAIKGRQRKGERVVPSSVTFGEWFPQWLDAQTHLRPKTKRLYLWAFTKHLEPRFGRVKLSKIGDDDVAGLLSGMRRKGYSGHTQRAVLTPLSKSLARAARRGMIAGNPCARLEADERPKLGRSEMRILDRSEIAALLAEAESPYRSLLALSIFTGLRQSEALGLTWEDVDMDAGLVRVRKQLGAKGSRVEPKTPQAIRDVVLMPSLVKVLREHWMASSFKAPTDFVFASESGTPLDGRNIDRDALAPALEAAGLTGRRLTFHSLRHVAASLWIGAGEDVVYVADQLGHADASITLRVYAKLLNAADRRRKAAARMESAYGNTLETRADETGHIEPLRLVQEGQ